MPTELPAEYEQYQSTDPFPEIPAALLNSADITDYVRTVKMIDPFKTDNLKPASYEIPFSGTVFWWDIDTRQQRKQEITSKDDTFELKSNSIAFVQPDTMFYLPDYIAIRFNLRITHVHQGLLLGTGPLVDPGFCGRLLIPLHNLTANSYTFVSGRGFIWVEFTKLSPHARWASSPPQELERKGKYIPFPPDKRFRTPDLYFRDANGGEDIVSSIPAVIQTAKESAKSAADDAKIAAKSAREAEDQAQKATKRLDRNLIIGIATGIFTIAIAALALGYNVITIFQSTLDSKTTASEAVTKAQLDGFRQELDRRRSDQVTKAQLDGLQKNIEKLEMDIERWKSRPVSTKGSAPNPDIAREPKLTTTPGKP